MVEANEDGTIRVECPACEGRGSTYDQGNSATSCWGPCETCDGSGEEFAMPVIHMSLAHPQYPEGPTIERRVHFRSSFAFPFVDRDMFGTPHAVHGLLMKDEWLASEWLITHMRLFPRLVPSMATEEVVARAYHAAVPIYFKDTDPEYFRRLQENIRKRVKS